jgi:tetratricopeptide (TPR) repeat protein
MLVALIWCLPCAAGNTKSSAQSHIVQVNQDGIKDQITKGDALLDNNKVDEAIGAYSVISHLDPHNFQAHQRLGNAYGLKSNVEAAIREDQLALAVNPKSAPVHQHLGWLYGISGSYNKAVEEANKALAIDPKYQDAYVVLGSALSEMKNYQPAIVALQKAVALDPSDFESCQALAATLGRKGDYKGAVVVFKKAIALRPKSVPAHLGLGAAYGKLGNASAEIKELNQAVVLSPDSAATHGHLGSALLGTGDLAGAIGQGLTANQLRLQHYGGTTVTRFLLGWGVVFLLFGVVFAVTFAGSTFNAQEGEEITKSFFLTFYKDRPGRFILTTRRIVFVPDVFSSLLHATRLSIELDSVTKVDSHSTATGGTLNIETADGSSVHFKMPNLVLKPLLQALEKAGIPREPVQTASVGDNVAEEDVFVVEVLASPFREANDQSESAKTEAEKADAPSAKADQSKADATSAKADQSKADATSPKADEESAKSEENKLDG